MPFYIFTPSTQRLSREIENGFYDQKFIPSTFSVYRHYMKIFLFRVTWKNFYNITGSASRKNYVRMKMSIMHHICSRVAQQYPSSNNKQYASPYYMRQTDFPD